MKSTQKRKHPPPLDGLVRLARNAAMPEIYDVELGGLDFLRRYDSVECHLVVYPYSRRISSRNITLMPFEEYVNDILTRHRSVYVRIEERGKHVFGALLGLFIFLVYLRCNPVDLFSLQSIVSVFGTYFVGKELWDDIEGLLTHLTQHWPVRYLESYYLYQLGKSTTLTHYAGLAKKHRYGKISVLPERIDFIQQSNSQTVRMRFTAGDLAAVPDRSAHILAIHVDPALAGEFESGGYMLGVKLSLNRGGRLGERSFEAFQSINSGELGCLDDRGQWVANGLFYRNTWRLGKVKHFGNRGVIHGQRLIETG